MGEGDHEGVCRERQLLFWNGVKLRVWKGVVSGVCWQTVDCSQLNPGVRGEHLTIQHSWLAT